MKRNNYNPFETWNFKALVSISFLIVFFISCKKNIYTDLIDTSDKATHHHPNKLSNLLDQNFHYLKEEFKNKNIPEDLLKLEQISGNDIFLWQIEWDAAHESQIGKTAEEVYVYIPMTVKLQSTGKRAVTVGYNRYVLAKIDTMGTHFSIVYTLSEFTSNTNGRFSGKLFIKDLEHKQPQMGIFSYANGQSNVIQNFIADRNTPLSSAATASNEECFITYLCSWNYWCSSSAEMYVVGTYATNSDCVPPSYNPCSGSTSDNSWGSAGSVEIGRVCFPGQNPSDPPPGPVTDPSDPSDPNQDIKDPCKEKLRVKERMENPVIASTVSEIRSKSNGNEWGAKVNAKDLSLKQFIKMPTTTNGLKDVVYPGNLDWDWKLGFTIGTVHNHPGGSAPSLDDVFAIITLRDSALPNGPSQSQESSDVWEANAFIAVTTKDLNYVVMVNDGRALQAKWDYYKEHKSQIDIALNSLRVTLEEDFGYTEGQSSSAALLSYLGNVINLYTSAPDSKDYKPLTLDKETAELKDINCL